MIGRPNKKAEIPVPERRAAKRLKTFIPADILLHDALKRVHVLNVSTTGALIHVGCDVPVSDVIKLTVSGADLKGSVAWAQGVVIGVQFYQVINIDTRDNIIALSDKWTNY